MKNVSINTLSKSLLLIIPILIASSIQVLAAPSIEAAPTSHDYGDVEVATTSNQDFKITNNGDEALLISRTWIDGGSGTFAVSDYVGTSIDPGKDFTLSVGFTPADIILYTATLHIETNDPAQPDVTASLQGQGMPPSIAPNISDNQPWGIRAGEEITLSGSGFGGSQGSSKVEFYAYDYDLADWTWVELTAITSWSDIQIVGTMPDQPSLRSFQCYWRVTVDGQPSNEKEFVLEPTLTSITPASGRIMDEIVLQGKNFNDSDDDIGGVYFGAAFASGSDIVSWSPTEIRIKVPFGAVTGDAVVMTKNWRYTNGVYFCVFGKVGPQFYIDPPEKVIGSIGEQFTVNIYGVAVEWSYFQFDLSYPANLKFIGFQYDDRIHEETPPTDDPGNNTLAGFSGTGSILKGKVLIGALTFQVIRLESGLVDFSYSELLDEENEPIAHETDTCSLIASPAGSAISGYIKDNTSKAISGVTVALTGEGLELSVTTNSHGFYIFSSLTSGEYSLVPSKDYYRFEPSTQTVILSGENMEADFTGTRTQEQNPAPSGTTRLIKLIVAENQGPLPVDEDKIPATPEDITASGKVYVRGGAELKVELNVPAATVAAVAIKMPGDKEATPAVFERLSEEKIRVSCSVASPGNGIVAREEKDLTFIVTDTHGRSDRQTIQLILDNKPPEIMPLYMEEQLVETDPLLINKKVERYKINGKVDEGGSNLYLAQVGSAATAQGRIEETDYLAAAVADAQGNFTFQVPFDPGRYQLEVEAVDYAGNVGTKDFSATIDTQAPIISQIACDGNLVQNGDSIAAQPAISFLASDDVGVDSSTLGIKIDGSSVASGADITFDPATGRAEFTLTLPLAAGPHDLIIEAKDQAGNTGQAEVTGLLVSDKLAILQLVNAPNPFGAAGTQITYQLTKPAAVEIRIYDLRGQLHKKIRAEEGMMGGQAGFNSLAWDGRDEGGAELANGAYLYTALARNSGGETDKKMNKLAILK